MNHRFSEPQFKTLLQIGIVVNDVEESVKIYEEQFGIGPWEINMLSNEIPVFKDLKINGEIGDFKIKCAMGTFYGLEIELVEPISDGPYKKWLEEHGPGVHHFAFLTKDSYGKILEDHKKMTGNDPWLRGQCEAIGMDFSYLDLTKQIGMFIEIYGENTQGKKGHDF